jgi:protease I
MAAKKILLLVGDFAEDYEVMVPFQASTLRRIQMI